MSPRTTDRPAPPRDRPRVAAFQWLWLLAAVATLVGLVGVTRLLDGPSFVERITVVNPTPYPVDVEVTGAERPGWLQLGEAEKRSTTVFADVLDQGSVWTFRLAAGEGGDLHITKAQLARSGWRVEIPTAMEARLRPTWGPPELLA